MAKVKMTFEFEDVSPVNLIVEALVTRGKELMKAGKNGGPYLELARMFNHNAPGGGAEQPDIVEEIEKQEAQRRVDPEEGLGQEETEETGTESPGPVEPADLPPDDADESDGEPIGLPQEDDLQSIPDAQAEDILAGMVNEDGGIEFGEE